MAQLHYERRKHKRFDMECPCRVTDGAGRLLAQSRGINISDGGMLLAMEDGQPPKHGARVHLDFSVPRSTPNTFLMEEFACKAFVVREEPGADDCPVRVAVEFHRPMDLEIEV